MTNEEWFEWIMRSIVECDKKLATLGSKLPDIVEYSPKAVEINAKLAESKGRADAAMKHLADRMLNLDGLMADFKRECRSNNIDAG